MKHAGTESEGTGGFLFCDANANALPLILVKLNSNCAAVSLCLLLQWSGSKTREKIKRKTLPSFTKKKEGRLSTLLPKIPGGWAFLVWQLTNYSTTPQGLTKCLRKKLAFELQIWICSSCPAHNCSKLKKVHLQTGISGPSCLGSGGIWPFKDRGDSALMFLSKRESGFRDISRSPASWGTTPNHPSKLLRAVRGCKRWLAVMS